jgi:signal peptidase I
MLEDEISWEKKTTWQKVKKVYKYVFEENTALSWIASIIVAFVVVKFIFYPLLSLILGTGLPLVAVISPSMDHNGMDFDSWWEENKEWYEERGIYKEEFQEYGLKNGFNKGDVIVLRGAKKVERGDTVVYLNEYTDLLGSYPVIHRVTFINDTDNSMEVKGDNNDRPDQWAVNEDELQGKAFFKIPYIGWLKIWFAEIVALGGK